MHNEQKKKKKHGKLSGIISEKKKISDLGTLVQTVSTSDFKKHYLEICKKIPAY